LNGANHQYYALYPPEFRTQYDGWWATPRNKVTPELTSLILRVCACSLHFIIEDNVKVRLETELDTDVLTFANRLHSAAEKLSASIAPGKGGLVNVQQLFLTAYWFKSAEKWTEAWHALSKAIRAANEIGTPPRTQAVGGLQVKLMMSSRSSPRLFIRGHVGVRPRNEEAGVGYPVSVGLVSNPPRANQNDGLTFQARWAPCCLVHSSSTMQTARSRCRH
jgi:hypothetical protein